MKKAPFGAFALGLKTPLFCANRSNSTINTFCCRQRPVTTGTIATAKAIGIDSFERVSHKCHDFRSDFRRALLRCSEAITHDLSQVNSIVLDVQCAFVHRIFTGFADGEVAEMQFGELQATHFESVVEAFAQLGAIDCRGFRSGLGTGLQVALDCRDHVGRGLTIATNAPQAILGETVALSGFGGDPVEFGGVAGGKAHDQDSVSALMTGIHSVRD
jgi:hypothetical protein